ncbi:histidinol phosphate phosphatase [Caloramator sp. mosi_1]|nr:histidinol phosphate phosphatase [Caloramator sp. mosi_1]WDC85803.1 histidinol phosphate phosphatase [Caloramator sp. mosi_1]
MFDCHIHSTFSTDSNMKIEEALQRAKDFGMGLIVTDHMDINYPIEGSFIFDCNKYFLEYEKYRSSDFLIGIELGLRDDCTFKNKDLVEKYSFDYVIGSIHVVDGVDIFQPSFYENRTKSESYLHYLNFMYKCIKDCDFIDSLGHINYVTRYARYKDSELYYNDFKEIIDEILKVIAHREKAIEINTRRLENKTVAINMLEILKRFKELGGKYITIGSDAHNIESIGANFDIAIEIANESDLDIVYFKNRQPIVCKY